MYKITLFDENNCPVVSGVAEFFVDQLDEFEEFWLSHPSVSDDQKSGYRASKAGQMVSDYYSTDESYNILQHDPEAKVLEAFECRLEDRTFEIHNFYGCPTLLYAKEAVIEFRKIMFKKRFYLIGRYQLSGACLEEYLYEESWRSCSNWGNKILKREKPSNAKALDSMERRRENCGKDIFAEDTVETCCWLTIYSSENENSIPFDEESLGSDEIFDALMRDILGEAGCALFTGNYDFMIRRGFMKSKLSQEGRDPDEAKIIFAV